MRYRKANPINHQTDLARKETALRDRAAIIEECARVYGEYIKLLEMENQSLAAIAYTHGIQCPDELVKRGEECRAAIRALKDKP